MFSTNRFHLNSISIHLEVCCQREKINLSFPCNEIKTSKWNSHTMRMSRCVVVGPLCVYSSSHNKNNSFYDDFCVLWRRRRRWRRRQSWWFVCTCECLYVSMYVWKERLFDLMDQNFPGENKVSPKTIIPGTGVWCLCLCLVRAFIIRTYLD